MTITINISDQIISACDNLIINLGLGSDQTPKIQVSPSPDVKIPTMQEVISSQPRNITATPGSVSPSLSFNDLNSL